MSFAIVLESRSARQADTGIDMPHRPCAAEYRVIARYAWRRCGAWAVTILQSAASPSYLLEMVHDNARAHTIAVSTPQEGFDLARRMIQRRGRARARARIRQRRAGPA
jgi:hypothetical protein